MPHPIEHPQLETNRLILRSLTEADFPAIFAIYSDPDAMRYWNRPPMRHINEARRLVFNAKKRFSMQKSVRWGLTLRGDDLIIGNCTLFRLDLTSRRAEIGYILGREFWGQGYMWEAATAVLEYGFSPEGLNLNRVEAELDPRNKASAQLLERLGFQREGLMKERWIVAGEISDSLVMGLLRQEWNGR